MLSKQNYHVEVFLFNTKGKLSEECQTNLERLKECGSVYFTEVSTQFDPPVLTERHLVVDGLFGWTQQTTERWICCRSEIY